MLKKIIIILFLINVIMISYFMSMYNKNEVQKTIEFEKNIVDIKNTNGLINTYSNLIKEIVPANAKQ